MYVHFFKPIIDFLVSLIALILLLPVLLIVTFLLSIVNKGKVWFLQKRPGKNEEIFTIIKFKTMTDETDNEGNLLPDNQRLTSFGNFIRKSSLDELPQLINVLIGDMSLIGPRPLLPEYLPLYNNEQKKRHLVKPGITGWAQVNGRNAINWQQKLALDVWYVKHISFLLDIKILLLTLKKVLKSEGVNSGKNMTMNRFKGNK